MLGRSQWVTTPRRLLPPLVCIAAALVPAPRRRAPARSRRAALHDLPGDNAWNERVDTLPVAADSAQLIASIGLSTGLHPDFGSGLYDGQPIGIPYDVVSQARRPVEGALRLRGRVGQGAVSDPEDGAHRRRPNASTGDRHAILIDKDACKLYELYALYPKAAAAGKPGRARSGA